MSFSIGFSIGVAIDRACERGLKPLQVRAAIVVVDVCEMRIVSL